MYNNFTEVSTPNQIVEGVVTSASSAGNNIVSDISLDDVPQLHPYGYSAQPVTGSKVVILQPNSAEHYLAGVITANPTLNAGEIKIQASSGAYIHLKSNGQVVINGLVISPSGNIL